MTVPLQDAVLSKKRKKGVKKEDDDAKDGDEEPKKENKKSKKDKRKELKEPKKLTGYMAFCAEHRDALQKDKPDLKFGVFPPIHLCVRLSMPSSVCVF